MNWLLVAVLAICGAAHAAQSQIVWEKALAPGLQGFDPLEPPRDSLALNAAGDLAVAVGILQAGGKCAYVARHLASSGGEAWSRIVCPGEPLSIRADPNGDVVLLLRDHEGDRLRVVKLAQGSGAVLWDRAPAVPNASLRLPAMGIDSAGEVVVAYQVDVPGALGAKPLGVVKYGRVDGVARWQKTVTRPNANLEEVVDVQLAASGDPYVLVVGRRHVSPYDRDWNVVRLSGSSGDLVWLSAYDRAGDDWARALALSPSGGVIVGGYSPTSSSSTAGLVVKLAEATGAIQWERLLDTQAADFVNGLLVSADGAIRAFGGSGNDAAAWTLRSDGTLLGLAFSSSPYGGRAEITHGAANGSGEGALQVLESGYGGMANSGRVMRLESATTSGWSTRTAGDTGQDFPMGTRVLADGSAVSLWRTYALVDNQIRVGARLVKMSALPVDAPPINSQGLWWKSPGGSESGWGVDLIHQGETIFMTWFTYDAAGKPTWLVATGLTAIQRGPENSYAGVLYRASGPPYTGAFDPASVSLSAVGNVVLTFADPDHGVLSMAETSGAKRSVPLSRFLFGSPGRCAFAAASAAARYDDLWWRPSEAGWGLDVVHQGDTLFATWYTYAADRSPTWFVASSMTRASDGSYSGTLSRTKGSDPMVQWDPAKFTSTPVGTARLTFSGSNAVFEATVDGTSQSRALTRYAFGSPVSSCP